MLDEKALRKPGFSEGTPVVLGDGQEWTLPKPDPVIYPGMGADGRISAFVRLSYGREHDDVFDAAFAPGPDADDEAVIMAQIHLAAMLLMDNYELPGGALAELLTVRPDQPESLAWWEAFKEAVVAQARLPLKADVEAGPEPEPEPVAAAAE